MKQKLASATFSLGARPVWLRLFNSKKSLLCQADVRRDTAENYKRMLAVEDNTRGMAEAINIVMLIAKAEVEERFLRIAATCSVFSKIFWQIPRIGKTLVSERLPVNSISAPQSDTHN